MSEIDYKEKSEEYLNNWKRAQADLENYRKGEAKRAEQFAKFANEDVILEVMELVDSLEEAKKNYPANPSAELWASWLAGLDSIIKQFGELFKKYGAERIEVAGKTFNPEYHEAIEIEPEGTELEEVRAGYTLHGKVIRPARVKIIK